MRPSGRYGVNRVFLATDDADVERETRDFPEFEFVFLPINRTGHDSLEFVDDQLRAGTLDPGQEGENVVTDITLLASADYFIGTFSGCPPKPALWRCPHCASITPAGNIGRIAYQLSSAWKGHQPPVVSLDLPWCSHWGHTWPVNGMPMAC
jgi:hypothetical protein